MSNNYKDTLNLPKTKFPMKANLANREPEMLKRWEAGDLYRKIREACAGREKFVLAIEEPTTSELARLANGRAHYDAEIRSCDAGIGRLFDQLRGMGVYDRALIVVMADHGENMEHPSDGQRPLEHPRGGD